MTGLWEHALSMRTFIAGAVYLVGCELAIAYVTLCVIEAILEAPEWD